MSWLKNARFVVPGAVTTASSRGVVALSTLPPSSHSHVYLTKMTAQHGNQEQEDPLRWTVWLHEAAMPDRKDSARRPECVEQFRWSKAYFSSRMRASASSRVLTVKYDFQLRPTPLLVSCTSVMKLEYLPEQKKRSSRALAAPAPRA